MTLTIRPCTLTDAKAFVGRHHRHNLPPQGGLCAVALHADDVLVGVGILGRPVARALDDGLTGEITRVCVVDAPNGCSMIYGALRGAAKCLGFRRVFTYTLASEPGSSLHAAGFRVDAALAARRTWDTPSRPRVQDDLFGAPRRPAEAKIRWIWERS